MTNLNTIQIDESLRLRTFEESYVQHTIPWYADPIVLKGTIGPDRTEPCSEKMILDMYLDLGDRGEVFIIESLIDNVWIPIGDATLAKTCMPIVIGEASFRQKGISKKVILFLLEIARKRGWEKISLCEIYKHNISSQRLFESCGFQRTGETETGWKYELALLES